MRAVKLRGSGHLHCNVPFYKLPLARSRTGVFVETDVLAYVGERKEEEFLMLVPRRAILSRERIGKTDRSLDTVRGGTLG